MKSLTIYLEERHLPPAYAQEIFRMRGFIFHVVWFS